MRTRILLIMTFVGYCAAIMQVLVVREFLIAFLGNELCIGIIFGAWLALIATGAWTGSWLQRRSVNSDRFLTLALLFLAATIPFELWLVREARGFLRVPVGEWVSPGKMAVGCFLFQTPVSFLIGAIFPLAVRACEKATDTLAPQAGRVYVAEAIGSLVGGMLFSFVFAGHVGSFTLAFVSSFGLMIFCAFGRTRLSERPSLGLAIAGVVVVVLGGFLLLNVAQKLDAITQERRWKMLARGAKLLRSAESRYTNIAVGRTGDQYALYVGGQYVFSFPDPYNAEPFAHFCMCERPDAKTVALIGVARPKTIETILRYPIERLELIELDPVVLDLVKSCSPLMSQLLKRPRLVVHHEDGRRFLKRCPRRAFDLIIVQMPDPSTAMLNRFYTIDFLRQVRRALIPDGVVVASLGTTVNYLGSETGAYARAFFHAIRKVFPNVVVTAGATRYFAAALQKGVVSDSPEELGRRFEKAFPDWEKPVESDYLFTPYHFDMFFPTRERVSFVRNSLARPSSLPLNRDARPVTYLLNLRIWAEKSGGLVGRALSRLLSLSGMRCGLGALFVVLAMVAATMFGSSKARSRRRLFLSIATTGFVAMSSEIIVVYAFQSSLGYVYQQIGLIVGMFMIGLASGAAAGNGIVSSSESLESKVVRKIRRAVVGTDGVLMVTMMLVPFLCDWARIVPDTFALVIFSAILAWVGFWTGWQFPVACAMYRATGREEAAASGILDGADHFGAFVGAIVAGVALVPILGLQYACWALAGWKLGILALWGRR